ncbi:MAG TPA: BatD family protein [Candidatus Polarisedimenticolaceae bacterium]|nr:BatD family protein [Candidatus Polarisedimenticolaceae bacterium]
MSLRALGALLLVTLALPAARADDVRVRASVLPRGAIYETTEVRLQIEIDGSSIPEVSAPSLPTMTNLAVAGGPQTSRSSSYVFENGRINASNSLILTYFLTPKGTGSAVIPAFVVNVGGTSYRTEPLQFQIAPGRSGPAPPAGRRPGAPSGGSDDDEGDEGADLSDVFLQSKLSQTSVWAGQAVVLEMTLYAAAPLGGFGWTDIPSMTGFWTEDIPVDAQREHTIVTMNNRRYDAFPVARKLLVPTSSGTLAVPAYTGQVQVRRASRDPFGSFFSLGRFANLVRKSNALKLEVKPLPETGRPASFTGAVGAYRFTTTADRKTVNAGDAVAVRATVEGAGSLQGVGPPKLEAPPDVKVYDPKVVEDQGAGPQHLGAKKSWEWVVVPLAPGTLRLPAPVFAYFDPVAGAYKELHGEIPEIAVNRGAAQPDVGIARSEVQAAAKDIAFLKALRGPLETAAAPVQRTGWFVVAALAPLLLVPIGILVGRRRERFLLDHGFARARRAARAAAKRLDRAGTRAGESSTAFHEEVAGALVDYVADRANRSAAGLTYDQLEEILAARGVSADLRRRYRACLESCDFARYVPDAGRPQARTDLVAEARSLVRALEEIA